MTDQQQIIDEQKREIARLVAKMAMASNHIDSLGVDLDTTEAGEIESMDEHERGYNTACTQISRILASEREVVAIKEQYWCAKCVDFANGPRCYLHHSPDVDQWTECDPVTVVVVGEKP